MTNAFKQVVPGGVPLASDLNQFAWALSGQVDVGQLSLFAPIGVAPPTVVTAQAAGVLNGAYKYVQVNVTGWIGNDGSYYIAGFAPSTTTATINPANQQVTVTLTTGSTGTIARILYRTTAGGSAPYFLAFIGDNTTTTYTDNIPDSSLGINMPTSSSVPAVYGTPIPASAPTVNTTGTGFTGTFTINGHNALTDGDAATRSFVEAYQNAPQSFPSGSWTTMICQSEAYDNVGNYSPATGRFTAWKAGLYIFSAGVYFSSAQFIYTEWFVNGTNTRRGTTGTLQGTSNTVILRLNVGDYVEYKVQTSTTASSTGSVDGNFFHAVQVG